MKNSNKEIDGSSAEINLLDYLKVVIKRRRMIVRNTLLAAVIVALISLILPKTYTAKTTLLPPDESDQSSLMGMFSNSPISFLGLPGFKASPSEIFVEILKSRSVAEGVLAKAYPWDDTQKNLYEIWDKESKEAAIRQLQNRAKIFANEQGIIEVEVEMERPDLAADVAQAFVAELDRVNREKNVSKAKNSRLYIEEQLQVTESNLRKASEALAEFQSKHKAVSLEEQTKVAIEKAGEIKGTIMAKEVELQVARQTMKPDNPAVIRLQTLLDELKKQYEHLQFGNSVPFEEQRDYFIPFADVPEVGLKLARLMREVKVQETVWQLLNQQYYSTKIQEARDTPTVQVLDTAQPPERRTSPKRALMVLVGSFLVFCFSMFWAFVLEYRDRVQLQEEDAQKFSYMKDELNKDFVEIKEVVGRYWQRIRGKLGK